MSSIHYTHTHTRNRTTSPTPLHHHASIKRPRLFDSDSDSADDYPYSGAHRPSRALVPRNTPSTLERLNIWSDSRHIRHDSAAPDEARESERKAARRVSFKDEVDEVDDDEEALFRRRVASFSRVRPRHISPPPAQRRAYHAESEDERVRPRGWGGEVFRKSERSVSEDFEARERSRERRRRERVWCDDEGMHGQREMEAEAEIDSWVRWRRVKRTRTEEWKPLAGWRRV